jgi:hypothetical protein
MAKRAKASCSDCYFRQTSLCALVVDAICPTFRAANGGVLTPPRQAQLVPRAFGESDRHAA